jgi:4-methylaminobutanoate oxidase (formaldehyde-forming)
LCTANVDGEVDTITYTQFLNDDGCLEADVTVCKLSSDRFLVIATDTMHRHVDTWLQRNLDLSATKHVFHSDVTGGYAQLNIQGPLSRQVMEQLTDTDMSHDAFPFRMAKSIAVGLTTVLCARITYVGELGYELHIPSEHALTVYDQVNAAGKEFGLQHAGLKALSSLRMEKAYRDYGHDMDNLDSLLEVGLGFTADYKKEDGFIGKDHVVKQKAELKANKGLSRRMVQVLIPENPAVMMYHGEVLWRNGVRVGDVRAASYGHTLGGAVGLGMIEEQSRVMVNKSYIEGGVWEVEVANRKYPICVSLTPMYDPKNLKIKA